MFAPLLLSLVTVAPGADAPRSPDGPPNVLLILCDDLGWGDLGYFGHPAIETPRLDELAAEGVRFTQFYAASPVCSPSRVGLLTGRTPDRAGVYDWIPGGSPVHLHADEPTLPALLNAAGYDTCHVGKWHLNGRFNSESQPQPDDFGFDHWFATQNNAAPSHRDPVNFVRDGQPVGPLEGYSCDLVADEAVRWLDGRGGGDDPWFLNVWFHEPHQPIASPPDLTERYETRSRTPLEAEYFANVANMDRAVGTLLDALDRRGEAGNTLVIFTSDNGPEDRFRYRRAASSFGSPGNLRGMKLWLYEGGVRVPGIVRWPGRVGPRTDDTPVGAVDLLPTLCELTGATPPARPLDGASLADHLLNGGPVERAVPLFWSYYKALGGPVAAVREGDRVLLGRDDGAGGLGRFELYDLGRDERQTRDLAPEQSGTADRLSAWLSRQRREVQAEGRSKNVTGDRAPAAPQPAGAP